MNPKNELDKPKKKNFFIKMMEEIKSIFAKEPQQENKSSSQFLNDPLKNNIKMDNLNLEKKDINLNIDPSQTVEESEIIKRRSKHLVSDSLNDRLELDDLSYYDLKILYNELIRMKK